MPCKDLRLLILCGCLLPLAPVTVLAQQATPPSTASPPREMPRPDQVEPGINTSAPPPPAGAGAGVSQNADSTKPAASATPSPPPAKGAAQTAAASTTAASKPPARKAGPDRLQLDATDITGNRELPKVLYIVPWKRSDLGDLLGKPPNSLIDDVLQPVDRDVFKRENRYYDALKPDPQSAPPAAPEGASKNP
jgi:hypothetical protein